MFASYQLPYVMLNLFQHLAQSASHQPFGVIPQRACVRKAGIVTLRGGRSPLLYTVHPLEFNGAPIEIPQGADTRES